MSPRALGISRGSQRQAVAASISQKQVTQVRQIPRTAVGHWPTVRQLVRASDVITRTLCLQIQQERPQVDWSPAWLWSWVEGLFTRLPPGPIGGPACMFALLLWGLLSGLWPHSPQVSPLWSCSGHTWGPCFLRRATCSVSNKQVLEESCWNNVTKQVETTFQTMMSSSQ
jgi:hypothetical protein